MRLRAIAFALPLLVATACSTSSAERSRATTARTETTPDAGAPAPTASTGRITGGDQSGDNPATRGDASATAPGGTSVDTGARASTDVKAHSDDQVLRGTIRDVTPDSMTIQASDGSNQTLLLVPETSVRIDGQDAHGADLREGLPVRASFNTVGRERIAVQVVAGQGAAAAAEPGLTPGVPSGSVNTWSGGGRRSQGQDYADPQNNRQQR